MDLSVYSPNISIYLNETNYVVKSSKMSFNGSSFEATKRCEVLWRQFLLYVS